MCKDPAIRQDEVMYVTVDGRLRPYHKNCGEFLSENQAKQYEESRVKEWSLALMKRDTRFREVAKTITEQYYGSDTASRCLNCDSVIMGFRPYCPYCKSRNLITVTIETKA